MNVSGALGSPTATSSRGAALASVLMTNICRMARTEILINRLMVRSLPDPTGPARPAFLLRKVGNRARAAQPNPLSASRRFVHRRKQIHLSIYLYNNDPRRPGNWEPPR